MKLLVLGASGGVGRHVVRLAVADGHEVTAVVREGTPYEAPEGVRLVRDDVLREGAIAAVMPGRDAVISSLGIQRKRVWNPWSKLVSPPDFNSRTARAIVAAMQACGVRRVVAVSAAGVGDSAPRMNAVMRALVATSSIGTAYRDLAEMERVYLEAEGIDAVCLRPVTLTDAPLTGRVREVDAFGATMTVSRADVARALLDAAARSGGPRLPQIAAG
jgi:putative NADH-flavin reductase